MKGFLLYVKNIQQRIYRKISQFTAINQRAYFQVVFGNLNLGALRRLLNFSCDSESKQSKLVVKIGAKIQN